MAARTLNIFRCIALLAVVLAGSTVAHAANDCPWLNEATASGILGGDATGVYAPGIPAKASVCTFTETEAGETRQLIISVEVAATPHDRVMELVHACDVQSVPLASIGNEAMRCSAAKPGKVHGERIIGRVRDQVFIVAITTTATQDPVLDAHELAMRSMTAAEQVSGNLF